MYKNNNGPLRYTNSSVASDSILAYKNSLIYFSIVVQEWFPMFSLSISWWGRGPKLGTIVEFHLKVK